MREWLIPLIAIVAVFACWFLISQELERSGPMMVGGSPSRTLIEVYEQHPAGLAEIWHVVVWWEDGEIRETMVHSVEARDRLVECVNN